MKKKFFYQEIEQAVNRYERLKGEVPASYLYRVLKRIKNNWPEVTGGKTKVKKKEHNPQSLEILIHWNTKGIIKHTKESKTKEKALSALDKFLSLTNKKNPKTKEQIIKAIDTYSELIKDSPIFQVKRKVGIKVGLQAFLTGCSLSERDQIRDDRVKDVKCWLDECSNRISALRTWSQDERTDKTLTTLISKTYCEQAGLDRKTMGAREYGIFSRASQLLKDFFLRQRTTQQLTKKQQVDVLFKAVDNRIGGKGVVFGNLVSSFTYSDILPRYVKNNLAIASNDEMVIQQEELQRQNL